MSCRTLFSAFMGLKALRIRIFDFICQSKFV
jgi:hypothetical protein